MATVSYLIDRLKQCVCLELLPSFSDKSGTTIGGIGRLIISARVDTDLDRTR